MNYHIDIDSYIGYPISKQYIREKLAKQSGKNVNVRINSYGGDVQTAFMYQRCYACLPLVP